MLTWYVPMIIRYPPIDRRVQTRVNFYTLDIIMEGDELHPRLLWRAGICFTHSKSYPLPSLAWHGERESAHRVGRESEKVHVLYRKRERGWMGRVATVGYSTPHHNWWFVLACLLGHTLHHVRTRTRLRARGRIIWFTVRTRRRPAFTFALIGISNKSGWLLNYSIHHLYLNYSQCWFFVLSVIICFYIICDYLVTQPLILFNFFV
jgi:hypothetical protein